MPHPLDGIRVLDLTRLLPGGICTLMLADQGAEVIKIEQPGLGDYARWYVPRVGDYAAVFHAMNRNKKSVVLDLKQVEGVEILYRLVQDADVMVESFRPKVSRRLRITYDDLKVINPRLIVCSLSGLGQTGARADAATHDLNLAALTGVLAAGNEQVLPIQAMDYGGAYLAAFAISTALYQRERNGSGTFIDVALLDVGISMMTMARAEAFARGNPPRPGGETLSGGFACYRVYRTQDDKPLVVAALEPKFWENFCRLAGRDDLITRGFLDPAEQPDLIAQLTAVIGGKTHEEWLAILADDNGETCVTPMQDLMQVAQDEQVQARNALYMTDGIAHTYTPFIMAERIAHQPAPGLGEHTDLILGEAGYSPPRLAALRHQGAIA